MGETPRRSLRADDTTWDRAKELAWAKRTSVSQLLRDWVDAAWKNYERKNAEKP